MAYEVESTLKAVLRAQKERFFIGYEGKKEVEIGGDDNF
jgi:hypothetical protein